MYICDEHNPGDHIECKCNTERNIIYIWYYSFDTLYEDHIKCKDGEAILADSNGKCLWFMKHQIKMAAMFR